MDLEEYRRKRHFRRTHEPYGTQKRHRYRGLFVVQKHAARRLHYDFRLELEGVLISWAVPKGPSLDPAEKRLAVHVEDHPLEYGDFEGVIPADEYGAGPVQLWDRGIWSTTEDAAKAFKHGQLHVWLEGQKLHGGWVLARMGRKASAENKENWLLIKADDDYASPDTDILQDDRSVVSGRTLDEIAAAPQQAARAERPVEPAKVAMAKGRKAPLPAFLQPQLATLVDRPPKGEQWLNEIKLDGYRILCRICGEKTVLYSRRGKDWTDRFRAIAQDATRLPVEQAWLDGEVTFVLPDGRTSFQGLQKALGEGRDQALVYFLFDLLYLDGNDLTHLPLSERKQLLADLLATADLPTLHYVDHLQGQGETFFHHACEFQLEGIIAKRANRPYRAGRGRDWLKVKCLQRQEFVVGGYTDPSGARPGFGALLLGLYDQHGDLVYTGRVGTGFSQVTLERLYRRLEPLIVDEPPFTKALPQGSHRGMHWVRPELVVEVTFSNWTRDGVLRQPSFQGLREDKPPREVMREIPRPIETMTPPAPSRYPGLVMIAGVALSNPDRVLYPQPGLNKRDLALYYEAVAERMLPQLAHRPLTLFRCPEGYHHDCFFQKHADETMPAALTRVPIEEDGERFLYLTADSLSAMISLVQMGVLEIHIWGSRGDRLDYPDRLVFDLDPDEGLPWPRVLEAAFAVKDRLDTLGLASFVKTTGGKGLHVVMPLARRHTWAEANAFAKAVALDVARRDPRRFTARMAKASRKGKVFIDYVRNSRGATAIAEYSTRARQGAPVAVPLAWDELAGDIRSDSFTVVNVLDRLKRLREDPWADFGGVRQSITKAMKQTLRST